MSTSTVAPSLLRLCSENARRLTSSSMTDNVRGMSKSGIAPTGWNGPLSETGKSVGSRRSTHTNEVEPARSWAAMAATAFFTTAVGSPPGIVEQAVASSAAMTNATRTSRLVTARRRRFPSGSAAAGRLGPGGVAVLLGVMRGAVGVEVVVPGLRLRRRRVVPVADGPMALDAVARVAVRDHLVERVDGGLVVRVPARDPGA